MSAGVRHERANGNAVHDHNGAHVEDAKHLERQRRLHPAENPHHEGTRKNEPDAHKERKCRAALRNGQQVGNVADQKDQDANEKRHLALCALKDITQIKHDIGYRANSQTCHYESYVGRVDSIAHLKRAKHAEHHKDKRGNAFDDIGRNVALRLFHPNEDRRQNKAHRTKPQVLHDALPPPFASILRRHGLADTLAATKRPTGAANEGRAQDMLPKVAPFSLRAAHIPALRRSMPIRYNGNTFTCE